MKKNSEIYWSKRVNGIFEALDKKDKAFYKKLVNVLEETSLEIEDRIFLFYQKYAQDNNVSYADAQKRVRKQDLSDYVKRAKNYRTSKDTSQEALNRLNAQYLTSKVSALELLKTEIDFLLIQLADNQNLNFNDYLKAVAKDTYTKITKGIIQSTFDERELSAILSYEWSGASFSSRIWTNRDKLVQVLKEELTRGIIRGDNPKVTASRIRKLIKSTKANIERLVRTETTFIANATIKQGYSDEGITKYEFSAHLDDRTSKICKDMNKEEFNLKDFQPGVNAPPMHPNCRSRIVPADSELNKYDKYLEK